ncbi:MAG: hypothetical protein JWQ16_1289 [Novosphingobium sp.]|nr:hypothetical protein [Novosphingobium sp.]
MDAPLYPPATRFERPQIIPRMLSTKDTAIADLQKNPAAWAIVLREIPSMNARMGGPLKVHLGSFSLQTLVQFGAVPEAALVKIDAQLKALGAPK